MVIPWKLANALGEPSHNVLILLGVAALGSTLLVLAQRARSNASSVRIGRTDLAIALCLAVFTLLGNYASALAIEELSPALLNVLLRADVLVVAVLGWALLGERVEGRFWLGAAVAVAGLIVLQGGSPWQGLRAFLGSGTGLAILAAACFSGLAVVTRRFIDQINPVVVNALRLWFAVGMCFAFGAAEGLFEMNPMQLLYASLAGLIGPFLGRLALMLSARDLEARVTTLATLLTPVATLFFAFLLLSDWPSNHELVGGAVMIAGISIPLLRRKWA